MRELDIIRDMKTWNVYRQSSIRPTRNARALLGIPVMAVEAVDYKAAQAELAVLLGPLYYEEFFLEESRPLALRVTLSRSK